jgi:hypothetical protein
VDFHLYITDGSTNLAPVQPMRGLPRYRERSLALIPEAQPTNPKLHILRELRIPESTVSGEAFLELFIGHRNRMD